MSKYGGAITLNVKDKDIDELMYAVSLAIKDIKEKSNRDVTIRIFDMIQASGDVPEVTGALKNSGKRMKDKYHKDAWIMGWVVPYARIRYYGVGQERAWGKVWDAGSNAVKKRSFATSVNGIPFWDRPFTRNSALVVALYERAITKHANVHKYLNRTVLSGPSKARVV